MKSEFNKRIISSFILFSILFLGALLNDYIFLSFMFIFIILSWVEWIRIIEKINFNKFIKFIWMIIFLMYLFVSFVICFNVFLIDKYFFLTILMICVSSDIGGYVIGKTFGGRKLTKISPKKTVAGSIGSFILSYITFALIYFYFIDLLSIRMELMVFILVPLIVSLICQLGDLFISYFKRKAKIKNTGTIIPGHGGILDRIDGIIFALPLGFIIISLF